MKEFDLKKYLSKYEDTTVDFFRFPGNYGDSLIWHGTKRLISSLNISEHYVDITSPKYNDVLFIDSGGNLVDYYSDIRDFLLEKPDLYNEIVILPHTIFGEKQIKVLNGVSSKLVIFCREKISAKFLEGKLTGGKVHLWHDCAFYNEFPMYPKGAGILNSFRTDRESKRQTLPKGNVDLSYDGYATKPLDRFIETLKEYRQVNTDRLHVAIGAALLGKDVYLYSNLYYKNKAVFDYSLRRFSNVRFIDEFTD